MSIELPIFARSVNQVEAEDLELLVRNNVRESKYIDYKSDLYGLTDSGKYKLLKHVSGFANAGGGMIIFGVEEVSEKPTRIVGVDINYEYASTIEKLIHECIEPTLEEFETSIIEVGEMKVFIISISSESHKPYMCSYRKNRGFFRRKNTDTLPMNRDEIKEAFIKNESWYMKDVSRVSFLPRINVETVNTDLLVSVYNNSKDGNSRSALNEIKSYIEDVNKKLGTRHSDFNAIYFDDDGYLRTNKLVKEYAVMLGKANTYHKSAMDKIESAIASTKLYMHFMLQVKRLLDDKELVSVVENRLLIPQPEGYIGFHDILSELKRMVEILEGG